MTKIEYDKAIADFNEAIRLDPENVNLYSTRAAANYVKKDYNKAIADFTKAIRLVPKNPLLYYRKACCYALQKRSDLALENLEQALELGLRDFKGMEKDSDLVSIRGDSRYKELLRKYDK